MAFMKARFMITFCALALAIATSVTASAQTTMTWTVNGEHREALVFSPAPTTSNIKHPLVFAFHGHGGKMQGTSQLMHIQTLWPAAIVVYPQGLPSMSPHDPQGQLPGWQQQSIEQARQVDNATGSGQTCGQYCTFYPSTSQTPVKTFIHPGGHVYPPWAPAEVVKFFKAHKHP